MHNPWDLTEEQFEELTKISKFTEALLDPPNINSNSNFTSQLR